MGFDFLTPIDIDLLIELKQLTTQHLASKVVFHSENEFPDVKKVDLAIIGVLDNRGKQNQIKTINLSHFRRKLYSLFPGNWKLTIADFGDILPGETISDTNFALQQVVSELIKSNVIPIVIGGSQDLTYALYRAYDTLEQMVNLVAVDSKFDFGKQENISFAHSYMSKIIVEEPNNLFNYSNVGYQTYYNSQEEIDLIEKMYFDAYRLGDVCQNIAIAEPVFRDADLVSIDMNAVKSADSGNISEFEPNGFNGKEICALTRYAGLSDKVSCLGVFNHFGSELESIIIAQMVWYFIEGVHFRSNEYPFGTKENYLKYIVPFENEEIIFYKSNKTGRWWIEIPFLSNTHNKLKRNTLLPCTHEDYLSACNQEFPERWWKAQRKNLL